MYTVSSYWQQLFCYIAVHGSSDGYETVYTIFMFAFFIGNFLCAPPHTLEAIRTISIVFTVIFIWHKTTIVYSCLTFIPSFVVQFKTNTTRTIIEFPETIICRWSKLKNEIPLKYSLNYIAKISLLFTREFPRSIYNLVLECMFESVCLNVWTFYSNSDFDAP